jgi:transcriptional regulator with XRE-family HTH domain
MHVSRERISQLESGATRWPGAEVFNDLSRALDVPVEELLSAGGIQLTSSDIPEEVSWLVDQLDDEGIDLLCQLGRALLPRYRRRRVSDAP